MVCSPVVRRPVFDSCHSAIFRPNARSAATLGVLTLLLLGCGSASAQDQERLIVTNNTGRSITYKYRATYNDGNGSDQRYFAVDHTEGKTLALTAARVESYGILLRLPDGSQHKLSVQQGPYEIRIAENPFGGTKVYYAVLDGKGQTVPVSGAPH